MASLGYREFRIESGSFTFVNAGHNPPLLQKGGVYAPLKVKPGFVMAGLSGIKYKQDTIKLDPQDAIFLYTDGITEAENSELELFGEARLLDAANKYQNQPLDEFLSSVKSEIDLFANGAEQADDITMLALRYK